MKKTIHIGLWIFLFTLVNAALFPVQRIIKVGVIDKERLAETFLDKSKDYTDYVNFVNEYNEKIKQIGDKITGLEKQKLEAKIAGNDVLVTKLEGEIKETSSFQKEYSQVSKNEAKRIYQEILSRNEFTIKMLKAIALVAEEDGYSIVMDISDTFYYAGDVDMTDKVIKALNKLLETK